MCVASWLSIVREVRDVDPPRRYAALLDASAEPIEDDLRIQVRPHRVGSQVASSSPRTVSPGLRAGAHL